MKNVMQNVYCKQIVHHLLFSSSKIKEIGQNCLISSPRYCCTNQIPINLCTEYLVDFNNSHNYQKTWKFNKAYVKFKKNSKINFFLIFWTISSKTVLEKPYIVYTYNVRYFVCTFIRPDRFVTQLRLLSWPWYWFIWK